ncbi:MAG: HAD family hydrolase [Candidatus Kariarchaeaceae archaeon]
MLDVVLFDFDGTLIDNTDFLVKAWNNAIVTVLKEEHPEKYNIKQFLGIPAQAIANELSNDKETSEKLVKEFRVQKNLLNGSYTFYDGIIDLLNKLSKKVILGLVTSRSSDNNLLANALADIKIDHFFQVVIGYHDTVKHKPDAEPLLEALKQLNITPSENAIYVGDSLFDMRSANMAGIRSIGAGYGPSGEKLLTEKISFYASTVSELEKILLENLES